MTQHNVPIVDVVLEDGNQIQYLMKFINLFPDCSHIKHLIQSNTFYNSGYNSAQVIHNNIEDIIIIENEVQSTSVINSRNVLMCKIYYDFEISVRFNCKHLIACKYCSKKVQICPVCRTIIRRRSDVIIC